MTKQPTVEETVQAICVLLIRGPLWGAHGVRHENPKAFDTVLAAADHGVAKRLDDDTGRPFHLTEATRERAEP